MPRIARVVVPDVPYHIINRGNHKHDVFLLDSDKSFYLKLLDENGERFGVSFLAFCLMDNHIHLAAIPATETSFALCFGEANRKYSTIINIRESWSGNMWEGRYHSFPMDDAYLYNAVRYAERNPVRAGIVDRAEDYPWSSARSHVERGRHSILRLGDVQRILKIPDWSRYLAEEDDPKLELEIERHARSGRPLGSREFIEKLEERSGRIFALKRPGRKPRTGSLDFTL